MRQKQKKGTTRKITKNIKAEIATGIILIVAVAMGVLIWLENKSTQFDKTELQSAPLSVSHGNAELKAPYNVVFLGDSITAYQNWNKMFGVSYITNAGIPGNTTDDIMARLSSTISSRPRKVFLMMGINDLLRGKDVDYVAINYEKILNQIQLQSPDAMIYVQSVLPTDNDISRIGTVQSQKIVNLNVKLKALSDEKHIFFIDLYPSFCDESGKMYRKYAVDGVHLSPAGYEVWRGLIDRYIEN